MSEPPFVLDSARVLAYAVLDQTVFYTGRITVYVGGKLLPPVPRLVICENLARDGDFLLCYSTTLGKLLALAVTILLKRQNKALRLRTLAFWKSGNLTGLFHHENWHTSRKFGVLFAASRRVGLIPSYRKVGPNLALNPGAQKVLAG